MTPETLSSAAARGIPVSFESVIKRYGKHTVLDKLSFRVEAGERVVLIGPSGSGKTTVLRCIMGFEPIDEGTIHVGSERIDPPAAGLMAHRRSQAQLRAVRAHVGMVFQQFNLFPHLTVRQNITLGPRRSHSETRAKSDELARSLLSQVGLADKIDSYPRQLSGGQQQRVAIVRALAMHPSVMLFDEVTSALDPETVGDVLRLIRQLTEASTMTMLLVTHEMGFAAQVADRVVFMENGCIVEQGPPEQIFGAPREERTEQFLMRLEDRGVPR